MGAKTAVPLTGAALEQHRAEVRADLQSRGKKVWSRSKGTKPAATKKSIFGKG